jgi:hypothetical protein
MPANRPLEAQSSVSWGSLLAHFQIQAMRIFVFFLAALLGTAGILGTVEVARAAVLMAGTSITATKADSFVGGDGDGKADPGETIRYTTTITNTGAAAATGVTFNDVIDAHTTLVGGSVDVSPLAIDDTYDTVGNTLLDVSGVAPAGPTIHVAGSLFSNDVEFLGDTFDATHTHITAHVGPSHGTLTLDNNAGTFTYLPTAGYIGPDSFTYTLTDSAGLSDTATVTLNVFNPVWYVKNDAGAGGDGRSPSPFNTLAAAQAASSASETIYVYHGDGTVTNQNGGFVLKTGQRLLGAGVALNVPYTINGVANPTLLAAGTLPLISNTAGDGVSITTATAGADFSGVEIRGLSIAGTTKAINLQTTSTFNGSFEVGNNTIRAAGTNGIDAAGGGSGTLTVNLHDNTVTATGNGINIVRTAGSVAIIGFANNVVLGATGGTGINIAGPNVTFDSTPGGSFQTVSGGTTTIGTAGNGVGASGMLLTSVAGDLSFTDLDIVSSAGAGLQASGTTAYTSSAGFQVAVGAGVASIDATGGPAVDLNTVTANTLPFVTVVSTNSATTGVSLDTVIGTFSAGVGSSITNATGTDFNINATSAAVTYGGTITDNSGRVVSVTSTAGGTKSFTGAISGSGAGSTGISLTNNTGATISFSGGLTLSTGANPAFTATGGGTVSATQNNTSIVNTLTTTTGTALNVANTTIGASGLTFRSITAGTGASGPANAIILNTTGASGGLTVSGNGGAGTGGTIQKTSGNGISLTSVGGSASLTDMNISNTAGDGITAATVNNFSCTLCNITNPGSAANKQGLNLNELSGTASLTNVTVTGATQNGAFIQNTSATLTSLTISGGSYSSTNNAFASAGSGLEVIAKTTGVITAATVTGVTFNANFSSAIQSFAQDTATIGDITVSGSTFTNNGAAAADFDAGTGSPQMKFHFLNNLTITGNVGPVINVFSSATGTGGLIQGRIDGNNIGTNAVVDSGSTGGAGIRVFLQGVAGNITIVNNTIRSTACSRGIEVQTLGPVPANGGVRQSDIVITGNNVNNFSSDCAFPLNDIYLTSDNQAGGAGTTLRAEVHNNTIKTAGATPGNTDFPFDNLEWLYFDHTAGTAQLVDVNPGAPHANANAAIAGTQTSGTAKANAAVTLIPGPITTVSFVPGSSVVAAALQPGMQTSSAQIAQTSNTNINDLAVSADLNTAGSNFKQASWVVPQAAAVDDLVALHTHATSGGNNSVSSAVQPAPAQSGEAVGPITIGTLPAGKSVKVVYDVTVDDPLPQNATKILNQSTISGSNFTTALTTDSGPGPDCTGPGTETCTPIDLVDLAASKTNDTSGTVVLGNSFNWAITASNIATSRDAIFTTGQTVLADHLPGAATYGSVSATYDTGIVGTMSCSISSNVLTCTADAGGLTIPSGKFVKATWQVTPTSGGSLVNPTGGVCTVDPNAVFAEVSTANNSCSDTVTVTRPNTTVTSINRHTPLGANTNASSVTWRVTFANALSGLTSSNFTLTDVSSSITGDSISSVTPVTGSPDTQWDVTASTGSTGDGTLRPDLANDTGLSYAVTNAPYTSGQTYTIDKTGPLVSSIVRQSPASNPTNSDTLVFRVTFNEAVTNVGANSFVDTGTTTPISSSVTAITPNLVFDFTIDGTADGGDLSTLNGTVGLNIAASPTITDLAGNTLQVVEPTPSATNDQTYTVDNTAPTVTVNQAVGQSDPTNGSTINFTVVFSEPVTGFATGDVDLSAGTAAGSLTGTVSGGPTTYNVAVTGMTGDGTVIASILANKAQDLAGNNNAASTSTDHTVTYDTTAPTVTINQAVGQSDPTNGSPINFTAVFSESVGSSFATGDVTLSGGAGATTAIVSEIAPNDGTTYNIAVSGMTGDGTVIASILANKAQDLAGNNNAASTSTDHTVTYDTTAPTVTINQAGTQSDPAGSLPINFTVTFSEAVTGFATGDVDLSASTAPGTLTGTVTGGPTIYNVAVSGLTGDGNVIATIPASVAQDLAGNNNAASTSTDNNVLYDTVPPSLTINQAVAQTDPTSASPINFTVTFSEAVTGFATGDVDLSAGTAPGSLTGTVTGGPKIYNVAVSGMTGSGTVIASVPAGVAFDLASHPNTASTSTDHTVTLCSAHRFEHHQDGRCDHSSARRQRHLHHHGQQRRAECRSCCNRGRYFPCQPDGQTGPVWARAAAPVPLPVRATSTIRSTCLWVVR